MDELLLAFAAAVGIIAVLYGVIIATAHLAAFIP